MNKPSVPDEPQVRRILKAQSRMERLRMRFAMRFRRCMWLAVINGTQAVKRLFDVLISIVALLLAAPLMTLIALLIRRDGGPVFSRQRRIGFNGRDFEMLKFRSTSVDAGAGDPRVTPIGRIIQKASIDELPQFLNVLCGDMSIVGPRPCLPREAALYSSAGRGSLHVKPGITCLWQVGDHSNIDFDKFISLDERCIETHSLRRDLWLLLKTIPTIVLGKGM